MPVLASDPQGDDMVIARRQVVIARGQYVRERLAQQRGKFRGKPGGRGQALCRGVFQFNLPVLGDHKHGVGRRGEGGLHGALGAQHFCRRHLAERPELARHGIERPGKLPELVLGQHRHIAVQRVIAQRHRGSREHLDRTQQRPAEPVRNEQ